MVYSPKNFGSLCPGKCGFQYPGYHVETFHGRSPVTRGRFPQSWRGNLNLWIDFHNCCKSIEFLRHVNVKYVNFARFLSQLQVLKVGRFQLIRWSYPPPPLPRTTLRSALEYVIRSEVLYRLNYYRGSNLLAAMMLQLNNPAQPFGTRAGGR